MGDPTKRETECWSSAARQVFCGVVVSAAMLEVGAVVAWPVVLPGLQRDNDTSLVVTDDDVKWLVSSTGIVGMVANFFAGSIMELVGPRLLLTVVLLPSTVSWLLQALTPSLTLLYIGRVSVSLIASFITTLTSPLMAELFEPRLRGRLCCLPEIFVAIGLLAVYVLAHNFSWQVVTCLCAAPLLPLFFLTMLVPESPFWLVRHGRLQEAEAALHTLRGFRRSVRTEELPNIRNSIQDYPQTTIFEQMKQFGVVHHYRPLILLLGIFILRELGGQYAVFSYTLYLFNRTGVSLDSYTCTILVGVVRLVSTIISSSLLDRVGRRPCLIGACLTCAVAAGVGGTFVLLEEVAGSASWVPLASVLVFVSAYGLGIGPVPWVLLGELLPTPVRSLGTSVCTFSYAVMQFTVGYVFPELLLAVGVGGALLVFGAVKMILTVVLWLFLPETRGQSLHELQDAFNPSLPNHPLVDVATNHILVDDVTSSTGELED
ncbi:facilitated trehalose transporter Tret1-like [Penaeus vannamei]|uniref:Sugar transporter n=1 Tax=Penaeus vannamei TaxID=6689 RepID=A0A423TMI4_PENVA|nr:sugar transporter [Penaeus vannamei]